MLVNVKLLRRVSLVSAATKRPSLQTMAFSKIVRGGMSIKKGGERKARILKRLFSRNPWYRATRVRRSKPAEQGEFGWPQQPEITKEYLLPRVTLYQEIRPAIRGCCRSAVLQQISLLKLAQFFGKTSGRFIYIASVVERCRRLPRIPEGHLIGNRLAEHLERLTTLPLHGKENPKHAQRAPRFRLSDYSRPRHFFCFVHPIKREGPEVCLIGLNHNDCTAAKHSSGIVKDGAGP